MKSIASMKSGKGPAIPDPLMTLVDAHHRLVHGCRRTASSPTGKLAGRPVAWVMGLTSPLVIAESWDQLHAVHRRKRGFSAVCDRLNTVLGSASDWATPDDLRLEVWSDVITPDASLLEKIGRQVGVPIHIYGPAEVAAALAAVHSATGADLVDDANPLVAAHAYGLAVAGHDSPSQQSPE